MQKINGQCEPVNGQRVAEAKAKKNPGELYFTLILLIINGAILVESLKMKGILQASYNEGGFLPQIISTLSIIMIVILGIQCIKDKSAGAKIIDVYRYLFSREVLILLITVVLYALVLKYFHFKLATFLFLFLTMIIFDKHDTLKKFIVSLCITAASVLIFATIFQVLLP